MSSLNTKYPIGAFALPTPRSMRVEEILKTASETNKFSIANMTQMQNDTVDVMAREIVPVLISISENNLDNYEDIPVGKKKALKHLLKILGQWDFETADSSRGAVIYNVWERFFMKKLFLKQIPREADRLAIFSSYIIDHFFTREIVSWREESNLSQ